MNEPKVSEPKDVWVVEVKLSPWMWAYHLTRETEVEAETWAGKNLLATQYRVRRYVPAVDASQEDLLGALKQIDELLKGDLPITAMVKEIARAATARARGETR